jgi:RNA polymerase-binding protein DksA
MSMAGTAPKRKTNRRQRALALMATREAQLRARVASRRAALERIRPTSEPPGDVVDLAFARSQSEVEYDLIDRDLRELQGIEQARARIDDGVYGMCADCGLEIDSARLNVNPAALCCADCQGRREKDLSVPGRGAR